MTGIPQHTFECVSSMSSGEWPVKCCIFGMRFVSSAGYHMTTQIDGFIWLITLYKNTSKLVCKVCCYQRVLTFKGFKLPLQGLCDSLCTPPTSIRAIFHLVYEIEPLLNITFYKEEVKMWLYATMVIKHTLYIYSILGPLCMAKSLYTSFPVICCFNWKNGFDILVNFRCVTFDIIGYK